MDYSFLQNTDYRVSEFWRGIGSFAYGAWLLAVPGTFASTVTFSIAAAVAPQWIWGSCFVIGGIISIIGIGLNYLPIRIIGAIFTVLCWGALTWYAGFANWQSSGIILFGGNAVELYFIVYRHFRDLKLRNLDRD